MVRAVTRSVETCSQHRAAGLSRVTALRDAAACSGTEPPAEKAQLRGGERGWQAQRVRSSARASRLGGAKCAPGSPPQQPRQFRALGNRHATHATPPAAAPVHVHGWAQPLWSQVAKPPHPLPLPFFLHASCGAGSLHFRCAVVTVRVRLLRSTSRRFLLQVFLEWQQRGGIAAFSAGGSPGAAIGI